MQDGATEPTKGAGDAATLVRSAAKLGGSLAAGWAVALGVRVLLPRALGPELFGSITFADAFSTVLFVPLGLGVDTYVRKEVSLRPGHAEDFLGGVVAARLALSAVLFAVVAIVMEATDRPHAVRNVVFLFGAAQLFVNHNATLAALLHARGRVDGLSLTTVAAKLAWGAGVVVAVVAGGGIAGIALALVVAEGAKCAVLHLFVRRHLGVRVRVHAAATGAVLLASLPYFVNALANTAYARVDVTFLAFVLDDHRELGFYGAAWSLAGITLLMSPLVGWVLTPHLSRALERSEAAFDATLRRAVQLLLAAAVPVSLMAALGADTWVRLLFGDAYAPAASTLRVLAPVFVFTYLATLSAVALILLGRGWHLTVLSLAGLGANAGLNLLLTHFGLQWAGGAGARAGAAAALVATEAGIALLQLRAIGGRAFDRESIAAVGKSLAACAAAVLTDRVLAPLGPARLIVDALVYASIVIAWGALPLRQISRLASQAFRWSDESASPA